MKKENNRLTKTKNTYITPYNLIVIIFILALTIWGVNSYLYQKKAMKNQSRTKAKVIHLRNSTGKSLSLYPYITYQFTVNGRVIERGQKSQNELDPHVGDCIEIIYSESDVSVSEIDFTRGIVPCD